MISPSVTLATKRNSNIKCKINDENTILDQIVEDGMPMQWQDKKYVDQQGMEFDMFVKNQTKENDSEN